ncbi:hypothetical protein PAM_310 [Onion yellows phytoplasma OY-M]|uniref:Uncharacterized protein n=3 Tax=16SrI (Aster yellows group) TaxID=3042590 RepID=Q6YQR3_ONYPE|nr:hypothetical protein PAM_310 [Onion yellows phytoplasma OY-M]
MWGPVFNTPDHTLTKWDGDVKFVKTATETPNNLLLLTSRAYDAQNNLLWGHEDTWDAAFYENNNQTKELYFAPESTSEADKKVDYQNESTCHYFYDQEGFDDGDFNRKRHYTLEDDQLKVDWAHKNTYDCEYNKDKLPKRKKYFNAMVPLIGNL